MHSFRFYLVFEIYYSETENYILGLRVMINDRSIMTPRLQLMCGDQGSKNPLRLVLTPSNVDLIQ